MTLYAILGHPRVVWAGKCFNPPMWLALPRKLSHGIEPVTSRMRAGRSTN